MEKAFRGVSHPENPLSMVWRSISMDFRFTSEQLQEARRKVCVQERGRLRQEADSEEMNFFARKLH